jgi:competence protein ComEC
MKAVACFLDVGQGDCSLFADLEVHEALIIDCPPQAVEVVIDLLNDWGVALRVAIISHSDLDHMGGIPSIVERLRPSLVYYNHDWAFEPAGKDRLKWRAATTEFRGLEDEAGITTSEAAIPLRGAVGVVGYTFLAPTHGQIGVASMKRRPNHASAIVKVEVGGFAALVTGDADAASWRRLLKANPEAVRSSVLRLPHHGGSLGAKNPTLNRIFDAVGAQYHIVSVGSNSPYPHPALSTLEALGDYADRARVMCTEVNPWCLGAASPDPSVRVNLPGAALRGLGDSEGALRCAGSVSFDLDGSTVVVSPDVASHAAVMRSLEHPMCIRHVAPLSSA